jgi:hypothetical protein
MNLLNILLFAIVAYIVYKYFSREHYSAEYITLTVISILGVIGSIFALIYITKRS